MKNGVLLSSAQEAGFDLLITCDQNIPYQQNLAGRRIAVLVLSANNWPRLRPIVAKIASAVDAIGPG